MQELTTQESDELKQLAPDSAEIINREHAALLADCEDSQDKARSARDRAVVIGTELAKVKKGLAHGKFEAWVEVNCPKVALRTAQRYMQFVKASHETLLSDDLSLRQAYVALDIIPKRPREQGAGSTFRGSSVPSVYDPLNRLTAFLGAVDDTDAVPDWMTEGEERDAVQRQYAPKLEDFILRLFGVRVQLLTAG